ncbi:hypothetical protein L7F22_006249 [Adiantum nelumboides]|nr:hypothetical protein [Adiantum nelumboides]
MGAATEVTQPSSVADKTEAPLGQASLQHQLLSIQDSSIVEFRPCVRSGVWYDIGNRKNMEDEHVLIDDLVEYLGPQTVGTTSGSYYGVFDGHDGKNAAQFVKEKLLKYIVSDVAFPVAVEEAVQHAFLETDAAFAEACSVNEGLSSGTTAITVLVLEREIFVANAGDCRAVLCRKGKAIEMSRDHKPNVERSRIEALGGFIDDGYLNGHLSVARAIGNWHIKGLKGVNCPLSAEPEVRRAVLTEDDEFMIIGCDGFWDVFTNENAVGFARRKLQQHNDPEQCSHELVEEALRRNTSDNLTVVVVCFQRNPPARLFPRFRARRHIFPEN